MSGAGGLARARQVELLKLVQPQVALLRAAPVFLVRDPGVQSQIGIAKSTLANVCQTLARHTERTAFENFLSQLERLDAATSQNVNNPSGQHRALKPILQRFLRAHSELGAAELLFVFSWIRRFLDDEPERLDVRARNPEPFREQRPESGPTEMEIQLRRAQERAERERTNH